MSTQLEKSDFQILDKADETQIQSAGEAVKQALCYELNKNGQTTRQITFIGLKWLALKMSQRNQSLEVIDSYVGLEKDDVENKNDWYWRAKIKCRNQKTGLETEGVAECAYFDQGKYDKFGRTKAHSKAERNAWRKQIPELEITNLLNTAKPEDRQTLNAKSATVSPNKDGICHCPDDATVPEWETNTCKNCDQKMSEWKIARIKGNE